MNTPVILLLVALAVLLAATVVLLAIRVFKEPVVGRRVVERFARRQRLTVTATNGPLVVQSLSVTHLWRTLGLSTGIAVSALWAAREGRLTLNFLAAFLGWFVGAVIAEWRLSGALVDGGRRVASLERRTVLRYLRREAAVLLALAVVALLAIAIAVVARRGTDVVADVAVWLLVALAALGVLALTLRRVAVRPQTSVDADIVAADDALRARSANVLAGSAIVAAGLPASALLALGGGGWGDLAVPVMILALVVGYLVAVTKSPARTDGRVESRQVATG